MVPIWYFTSRTLDYFNRSNSNCYYLRSAESNHYLTEISLSINGEVVAKVLTGSGVATDPLFGWRIAGVQRGDTVTVAWRDNLGNTQSKDTRAQ